MPVPLGDRDDELGGGRREPAGLRIPRRVSAAAARRMQSTGSKWSAGAASESRNAAAAAPRAGSSPSSDRSFSVVGESAGGGPGSRPRADAGHDRARAASAAASLPPLPAAAEALKAAVSR
jgi:hypothetical protein